MNFSIHPSALAAMGSLTQDTDVKAVKEKMDTSDYIKNAYLFPDLFIMRIFKHSTALKELYMKIPAPVLLWTCSSPGPVSVCPSVPLSYLCCMWWLRHLKVDFRHQWNCKLLYEKDAINKVKRRGSLGENTPHTIEGQEPSWNREKDGPTFLKYG